MVDLFRKICCLQWYLRANDMYSWWDERIDSGDFESSTIFSPDTFGSLGASSCVTNGVRSPGAEYVRVIITNTKLKL
jgi:hypothetical protein